MAGRQMEGDNTQRRKLAKSARDRGKRPSAVGATFGASKQRTKAAPKLTHQKRIDLKREGKQEVLAAHTPKARPGSRDRNTPDRESHPRL
jgi:hypothetical protein